MKRDDTPDTAVVDPASAWDDAADSAARELRALKKRLMNARPGPAADRTLPPATGTRVPTRTRLERLLRWLGVRA